MATYNLMDSSLQNSPTEGMFSPTASFGGGTPRPMAAAGAMPTAGEYYFGGGGGSSPNTAPLPQLGYGGPTLPEGYNRGPSSRYLPSGGSINLGSNVHVPLGQVGQRYNALLSDPSSIQADPYYNFLQQQGEQALGRSAGARRMRFAGKTMLDFQNQGQGLAAGYLQQLLPQLRAGAQDETARLTNEALATSQENQLKALSSDPYGVARSAASKYRTLRDYQGSPEYAAFMRAGQGQIADQRYQLGQRLNQSMGL